MTAMTLPVGIQQEVDEIRVLLTDAQKFVPRISRKTLCHRLTGAFDFEARLLEGRIRVQTLIEVKQTLKDFIAEKQAEAA